MADDIVQFPGDAQPLLSGLGPRPLLSVCGQPVGVEPALAHGRTGGPGGNEHRQQQSGLISHIGRDGKAVARLSFCRV
ncbi:MULTISPECIES: hypothetical protein [unclassified Nonomuraea]|uniref:hypothetical protein n=1 Tax=unclassified Nonomuraea TaxID=2593643 RepID=UPI00207BB1A4|nr:hypothetical protein [Nonomuraea sp. KC401]